MKELLLAKSNIRKSKGLTVGLILLIILTCCFLNVLLILFTDFNSNAQNNAIRLNSEDAYISVTGDISKIDDEYIKSLINDDVKEYEITRQISTGISVSTPYGDGTVTPSITFEKEDKAFSYKIGKNEIVLKDDSITENFVYLPYQYHTGGGFNVGDNYEIKLFDKNFNLKIKGFINNMFLGSYNLGNVQFVVSQDVYDEITNNGIDSITIKFKLKDNVDVAKFVNNFAETISKDYPQVFNLVSTIDEAIFGRTFVAIIFEAIFLVVSIIIVTIVLLMLSNNISNYIKENMKTIGAIKAIGYTNNNIKASFFMQFTIITLIGAILGIVLSYFLAPAVTSIISIQSGFPYNVSFNMLSTIATIAIIVLVVALTVGLILRKTNKIEPITALRNGITTHNFKKNRIKLESTKLPINISLALKTTFFNIKQNIVTFIIIEFLVFLGVAGLVLYQNFAVNPKLSILSFEICDAAIAINDKDVEDEIYNYMSSNQEVENLRLVSEDIFKIEDARLVTYILDASDKLNNKDVCYKGRLPKYDNEIAISGKLCANYNYNIGDEVELSKGDKKEKYIISGYIQTSNNNGREAVLLQDGAEKILGKEYTKMYYFETSESVDTADFLKRMEERYGDKITSFNFEEIISGSISAFKIIAKALVILTLTISALIILLVLYLLIKTLINNKKKDYGILKAIGYTSKDIILQNALSFMPTIILAVVISSIVSYFIVNPSICLIMNMFGIMKLSFDIPLNLVIFMGIGFIVISFVFALLLSRKIKKIEPYKLLTEE